MLLLSFGWLSYILDGSDYVQITNVDIKWFQFSPVPRCYAAHCLYLLSCNTGHEYSVHMMLSMSYMSCVYRRATGYPSTLKSPDISVPIYNIVVCCATLFPCVCSVIVVTVHNVGSCNTMYGHIVGRNQLVLIVDCMIVTTYSMLQKLYTSQGYGDLGHPQLRNSTIHVSSPPQHRHID